MTTRDITKVDMSQPRLFRPQPRKGEVLAMKPEAVEFSYLYTGCVPNDRLSNGIAIVTINGPLEHHATPFWDSYEAILERVEDAMTGEDIPKQHALRYALDDEYEPLDACPARAVILKIDSPGGEAAGATYAHRKLRRLRAKYNCPIFAYANETACSAAYSIASAADEIWLPDTGTVGSIGVIATLFDRTKQNAQVGLNIELITSGERKADGHADRPINDGIRERMQERVDDLAYVFWNVVANARNTNVKAVASLEAGVFTGQKAVDVGVADGVATWDKFVRLVSRALDAIGDTEDAVGMNANASEVAERPTTSHAGHARPQAIVGPPVRPLARVPTATIRAGGGHYVWVANDDACDDCSNLDGETYDTVDDAPDTHPNCKCAMEWVPAAPRKKKRR